MSKSLKQLPNLTEMAEGNVVLIVFKDVTFIVRANIFTVNNDGKFSTASTCTFLFLDIACYGV